ncbi:MAG TPA: hypothetical protein VER03_11730 [Bryobacteraceae bacterium]|nr:hypothetical protein [Bryobacteraceae bacterium]
MNKLKRIASATLALALLTGIAQAQSEREPWQGTFTKALPPTSDAEVYVDMPLPPLGKILTVERVAVALGPTLSAYGRIKSCQIISSHPKLQVSNFQQEDKTRLLLPKPFEFQSNLWIIPQTPILIYAEFAPSAVFRVACMADAIANGDKLTATVTGYMTAK